jgi:hypothetical protein
MRLAILLMAAYTVEPWGPVWLESDRFNIVANDISKADDGISRSSGTYDSIDVLVIDHAEKPSSN